MHPPFCATVYTSRQYLNAVCFMLSSMPLILSALFLSSNDKTIKELRDRLLRTRGHPQLDKISDINVICGVVKDFLRSLREPLLTFALHETFINAACKSPDQSHACFCMYM